MTEYYKRTRRLVKIGWVLMALSAAVFAGIMLSAGWYAWFGSGGL